MMKLKPLFISTLISCSCMQLTMADPIANQHAPAGVMYEHLHEKGQWMLGYNIQQLYQNHAYFHASKRATPEQLGAYSMLAEQHQMYMHMLHIMYAPTNDLTLTFMPMYMSMNMLMGANPNQLDVNQGEHGSGHSNGGTHASTTEGWGDTIINASYRALQTNHHQLITSLALSAPTGEHKKYGQDNLPVHYGMQIGAGIWQAIPSITYLYSEDLVTAGIQLSTRQPIFNDLNSLGYYVGDQHSATAWFSYLWHPNFSTSARIQYSNTDTMQGHYKTSHNHSTPADFQSNYGGEQTYAGFGFNSIIPLFGGLRTGLEFMTPIHENLKGVQQRTAHIWNLSISRGF